MPLAGFRLGMLLGFWDSLGGLFAWYGLWRRMVCGFGVARLGVGFVF